VALDPVDTGFLISDDKLSTVEYLQVYIEVTLTSYYKSKN